MSLISFTLYAAKKGAIPIGKHLNSFCMLY